LQVANTIIFSFYFPLVALITADILTARHKFSLLALCRTRPLMIMDLFMNGGPSRVAYHIRFLQCQITGPTNVKKLYVIWPNV